MFYKIILIFSLSLIAITGCSPRYIEVTGEQLEQEMIASDMHSIVSWWLVSESPTTYYILKKKGLDKKYYSVNKKDLFIRNTSGKKYPINLKARDLEFK